MNIMTRPSMIRTLCRLLTARGYDLARNDMFPPYSAKNSATVRTPVKDRATFGDRPGLVTLLCSTILHVEMTMYNHTRYVEDLLTKNQHKPPSFTVNLFAEHWILNQGPKFLYNNHVASLLEDIRNHQIPVDFLDTFEAAKVPFYEGCMIVELLDHRPPEIERTRTVLHPTAESLYADICSLNAKHGSKWTDADALEIESKILLATSPPLCLDPDPSISRMVNHVVKVSAPTCPVSLKRKASAVVQEEDETGKARRAKIMQFMASRSSRPNSNYRLLDGLQAARENLKSENMKQPIQLNPSSSSAHSSPAPPAATNGAPRVPTPYGKPAPTPAPDKIQQQQQKEVQMTQAFTAASHPHPAQQHFLNQNPAAAKANTPSPRTQTPHQAHQVPTFAVQAQDPASRNPTPSKQQQQPAQASPRAPAPHQPLPAGVQQNTFQPPMPNAQFLQQVPTMRNSQLKMAKAPVGTAQQAATNAATHQQMLSQMTPQQQAQYIQRYHALQQQQQQQQQLQQQQQSQAPTPQTQQHNQAHPQPQTQAGLQPQQAPASVQQQHQQQQQHAHVQLQAQLQNGRQSVAPNQQMRMSPHVTNQRIASQSPMPLQAQAAAQAHATPIQTHASPHPTNQAPHVAQQQHANPAQHQQMYPYGNVAVAAAAAQYHQRNAIPNTANTASPRPNQQGQPQQQQQQYVAYGYATPGMYRVQNPQQAQQAQQQMYMWTQQAARMNPQAMQGVNLNAQQMTQLQQQQMAAHAVAQMKPGAAQGR